MSPDINAKEVVQLYENGLSLRAVASQFGVHPSVIKRRLAEAGVQCRTMSEAAILRHEHYPHPMQGKKRPEVTKRMKEKNPIHMLGAAERRAQSLARTCRAEATPTERRFEKALNRIGLKRGDDYLFQAPVGPYVTDFLFPAKGLAVEIDGRCHRSPVAANKASRRDAFLASRGFETIHIPHDDRTRGLCGEGHGKAINLLRRLAGDDSLSGAYVFGE